MLRASLALVSAILCCPVLLLCTDLTWRGCGHAQTTKLVHVCACEHVALRYAASDKCLLRRPAVCLGNIECPVSLANTLPRFSTCVGVCGVLLLRGCCSWV